MGKTRIAFSDEIDPPAIRKVQKQIEENGQTIDLIVNRIVSQYCETLDEYMTYIRNCVSDQNNPPTNQELDDFALNLPVLLYFTGEAQEALGIKEDVAKAIKQEIFNEVYDRTTGTIGDKNAAAELASQNEFIAYSAYQRAYKKIKLRMESANEMLQSVKKVLSRRMSEFEIAKVDDGRFRNG